MRDDTPNGENEMNENEQPQELLTHPSYEELLQKLDEASKRRTRTGSAYCACRRRMNAMPCAVLKEMWQTPINMPWKSL